MKTLGDDSPSVNKLFHSSCPNGGYLFMYYYSASHLLLVFYAVCDFRHSINIKNISFKKTLILAH